MMDNNSAKKRKTSNVADSLEFEVNGTVDKPIATKKEIWSWYAIDGKHLSAHYDYRKIMY